MPRSEIEDNLLGCILLENALLDGDRISEDLFVYPEAKEVFRTMRALREAGSPVDILTISEANGRSGKLPVSRAYISELSSRPSAANVDWYLEKLRESLALRTLRGVKLLLDGDLETGRPSEEIINALEARLLTLRSQTTDAAEVNPTEALHRIMELAEQRVAGNGPLGVPTGFASLDAATGGLLPESVYLIAARTSVGKTALALSMADHQARKGIPVGYASLEMSGTQVYSRLLGARSGVSSSKLRYGRLAEEDFTMLMMSAGPLRDSPLMVLDRPGLSLRTFTAWAYAAVGRGAKVLYLDYVGLLATEGDKPRWERMAEVSSGLKSLSRKLKVPVVALVQLNRAAAEVDGPPGLHQLRDSGALEQDADVVILLVRTEGKDDDGDTVPGKLYVEKNRDGPKARVLLTFHRPTCVFKEAVV